MDPWTLKRVIKKHYEQVYAYKFYNLDEMNQFLKGTICPNLHKKQTI